MYNGNLIKNEVNGIWMVKWSDLHSFGIGTHWNYTELSKESTSIKYIENNEVMSKPLLEGLNVEFELITDSPTSFIKYAKLVFPFVDIFEKNKYIVEYYKNGGESWSITDIKTIRDGGTIMLVRPPHIKLKPFYLHKDHFTLHSDYPTTDDNLITDKPTQIYVLDRLEKYKRDCEYSLDNVKV